MSNPAQATVTATEVGGVLTVTVGAGGDNPTLSTTTSGSNIFVNGGGFTGRLQDGAGDFRPLGNGTTHCCASTAEAAALV